ncbi:hypothetical protein DPMN_117741 [Dreissena polymorpha]|uniref:Uncharacterized protein n=1 Tax=Dreissena polymorpha TaxID=45954 RepID=A0A9D4JPK6_DREPO|nr:hypothetical protein DPMN_117741 [Dreissena polymorpha]
MKSINYYSNIRKNDLLPGGHVFQQTKIIFKLIQDVIGTFVLTKENASPKIVVTNLLTKFQEYRSINAAPSVLTRFYYSHITKNAPPPVDRVFQPNGTIFQFVQYIIGANLLTKFHDDRTINVASRVLTRVYYSHIRKNALSPGGHVFLPNGIIFELVQDMIDTYLLTKFHKDRSIYVATRVTRGPERPKVAHLR